MNVAVASRIWNSTSVPSHPRIGLKQTAEIVRQHTFGVAKSVMAIRSGQDVSAHAHALRQELFRASALVALQPTCPLARDCERWKTTHRIHRSETSPSPENPLLSRQCGPSLSLLLSCKLKNSTLFIDSRNEFIWVAAFSFVHGRYLIRGQNRHAKPITENPMKRYGQKLNARCRCLRSLRLEFGTVPTAATRIGAIVYSKSRRPAKRQIAPTMVGFPRP
jgi:hypothetical protein